MDNSIITIVSLNQKYIDIAKKIFKYSYNMLIQDYKPQRKTVFYVSPANTLGFMDGGIDKPISRIILPDIEKKVKNQIQKYGKNNLIKQKYLPIGSSIIIKSDETFLYFLKDKEPYLVVAPTMLLPQPINNTKNVYYATMTTLYNILINNNFKNCEIIFTSMGCGYGKLSEEESFKQFLQGIKDFQKYTPHIIDKSCVIHEPNLNEQLNFYENTAFKNIKSEDIIKFN